MMTKRSGDGDRLGRGTWPEVRDRKCEDENSEVSKTVASPDQGLARKYCQGRDGRASAQALDTTELSRRRQIRTTPRDIDG